MYRLNLMWKDESANEEEGNERGTIALFVGLLFYLLTL